METKEEAGRRIQKVNEKLKKRKCPYCNHRAFVSNTPSNQYWLCWNCGCPFKKGMNMKRVAVIAIGITVAACILLLTTGCPGAPVTKTEAKLHLTQLNKFGEGLNQLLDDSDLRESEPARDALKLEYQTLQESGEKLAEEAENEEDNTE